MIILMELSTSEKDEKYQSYFMHEHMYCVAIDCVLMCYMYCLDDLFCLSIDTLCIIARNENVISSYANKKNLSLFGYKIYIEAKFVFVSVIIVNVDVWVKSCVFWVVFEYFDNRILIRRKIQVLL